MAQTHDGAMKVAAGRAGVPLGEYLARVAVGEKWCWKCKAWHPALAFAIDRSRHDGLAAQCRVSRSTGHPKGWHAKPIVNPLTGRPGPAPAAPRDGDKLQARQRINVEVREGRRPHPNTLPCKDCGHVWVEGERRHEYDHHLGYAAEHHYDVEPVCTKCHHKRDNERARATHCQNGHEYSPENTIRNSRGHRTCRECRKVHDRKRIRPPGYWQKVNARRRSKGVANG